MKINNRFSIKSIPFNVVLVETYDGLDKDGKPKKQTREHYYPSLRMALAAIIDLTPECDESLTAALSQIQEARRDVFAVVDSALCQLPVREQAAALIRLIERSA